MPIPPQGWDLRKSKVAAAIWKTRRREADSFSGSDLLLLSKLADQAHTETEELRKADGQAGPP